MDLARPFELLAAIDLRGGQVVRLQQGDFARETAFSREPAAVARRFVDEGARWLHVVDLDGARDGQPAHASVIKEICEAVGRRAAVEVAGGLRDEAAVAASLALGASRVVIGTAALEDPALARRLVEAHGDDRVVVALDVREGRAVGHAWSTEATGVDAGDAIRRLTDVGITTFEVTAIERDGMLIGPDIGLYQRMVRLDRGSIIASAGIATLDDLRAVRAVGCAGAIVGRALYEGRFSIADAMDLGPTSRRST